jgi:hypothetical protein
MNLEVAQAAFKDELEKISFAITEKGHKFDAEKHRILAEQSAALDALYQQYGGLSAPGDPATFGGVLRFGPDQEEGAHRHHEYVQKMHEMGANAWNPLGGILTPSSYEEGGTSGLFSQLGRVSPKPVQKIAAVLTAQTLSSFSTEMQKIGGCTKLAEELTSEARSKLPGKDFAVKAKKSNTGQEAYPIPDRQHARSALGFAKMHGDSADLSAVRAKIKSKFPDMLAGEK